MKYLLMFTLVLVVLVLTTNYEKFTETFGLSGYTKPKDSIKLDDPRPDLSAYRKVEAKVDNDMMAEFVSARTSSRRLPSNTTRVMRKSFTSVCL